MITDGMIPGELKGHGAAHCFRPSDGKPITEPV